MITIKHLAATCIDHTDWLNQLNEELQLELIKCNPYIINYMDQTEIMQCELIDRLDNPPKSFLTGVNFGDFGDTKQTIALDFVMQPTDAIELLEDITCNRQLHVASYDFHHNRTFGTIKIYNPPEVVVNRIFKAIHLGDKLFK